MATKYETVADIIAERDALRKDAERYRWVKLVRPGALLSVAWGESKAACSIGDDPDAAIDAAMAARLAVGDA